MAGRAMDEEEIVDRLKAFCGLHSISTTMVLVITIQENRTTKFSSHIVDFEDRKLLQNYPIEMCDSYNELQVGKFSVCYKDRLDHDVIVSLGRMSLDDSKESLDYPFCCSDLEQYRGRRIDKETLFSDFLKKRGNYPNAVFEVKKQVDNGSLLWVKNFQLIKDGVREVEGNFSNKLHAFKNYKCPKHKLFFAVDLFSTSASSGSNYHHMRLNPFSKVNTDVLNEFFAADGV